MHIALYDNPKVRHNRYYYGRIENLQNNIAEKLIGLYIIVIACSKVNTNTKQLDDSFRINLRSRKFKLETHVTNIVSYFQRITGPDTQSQYPVFLFTRSSKRGQVSIVKCKRPIYISYK